MAQTYQARRISEGRYIDYTPSTAVDAGDVVVLGDNLVCIATSDIAASALGALATDGVYDVVITSGNVSEGDALYWDADGNPQGGTAGSGAASSTAGVGPFMGWATEDATGGTDEKVRCDLRSMESTAAVFNDMTAGTGISTGTGTICEHRVTKVGGLYKTEILVDLTGLNSGNAAGDIIGKDGGTANCHIGQITAAVNGTIIAGRVTCFETPAGGDPDINIFSATVGTGAQDAAIADLVETSLINHGDWTAEDVDHLDALPAANAYLYLTCGDATDADYTAGILLIELWGK